MPWKNGLEKQILQVQFDQLQIQYNFNLYYVSFKPYKPL